jgi:hypothetical protein
MLESQVSKKILNLVSKSPMLIIQMTNGIDFTNTEFIQSTSGSDISGVIIENSTVKFTGGRIDSFGSPNTPYGGGMLVKDSFLELDGLTIDDNNAIMGGGIAFF